MNEENTTDIEKTDKVSTKSRRHFKYRSNECLNCKHPLDLSDRFCPYCSQLNSTKQLSLGDFFSELINSIVSYDSRLRFTVKDLLFKPGVITRNFVNGQRLKYANPFRFFLSISIIYFIAATLVSTYITDTRDTFNSSLTAVDGIFSNAQLISNDTEAILEEHFDFENGAKPSVEQIADTIKKYQALNKINVKDSLKKEPEKYITTKELDTMSWGDKTFEKLDTYISFYDKTKISDPKVALDSLGHDNTKTNRWLYNKNNSIDKIKRDPYGFYTYMVNKIPFFLFFFTPIFALFFWLFYAYEKISYVEHVVFIFHIFSFIFLSMLIALIPDTIIGSQIFMGILFALIGPFYFYKALRNFYKENRFLTIVKFILLNIVFLLGATTVATIFFLLTWAVY